MRPFHPRPVPKAEEPMAILYAEARNVADQLDRLAHRARLLATKLATMHAVRPESADDR